LQSISTIGLDIATSAFQVHGVDAAGQVVLRRQLKRRHFFLANPEPSTHGPSRQIAPPRTAVANRA
jgi:hypothetical protein